MGRIVVGHRFASSRHIDIRTSLLGRPKSRSGIRIVVARITCNATRIVVGIRVGVHVPIPALVRARRRIGPRGIIARRATRVGPRGIRSSLLLDRSIVWPFRGLRQGEILNEKARERSVPALVSHRLIPSHTRKRRLTCRYSTCS